MILVAIILTGCGANNAPDAQIQEAKAPNATKSATSMLPEIQSLIAEQLGKRATEIDPDQSFAALGADDLDLVEITMVVEDKFGITIDDDAFVKAAGVTDAKTICNELTVRAFAAVAEKSPKQPQRPRSPVVATGVLRESQVGVFGELSQLPNPDGLVLVFVPGLEALMQLQVQNLGRKLHDAEIEALRQKAVVIALPAEMADTMKALQSERDAARKPE
jgi:acyl carrier protein